MLIDYIRIVCLLYHNISHEPYVRKNVYERIDKELLDHLICE